MFMNLCESDEMLSRMREELMIIDDEWEVQNWGMTLTQESDCVMMKVRVFFCVNETESD